VRAPAGRSETTRVFCETGRFKEGVKERGRYGCAEWLIRRGKSDK